MVVHLAGLPSPFPGETVGDTYVVYLAQSGAGPEDGFTCYAYFVGPGYGGCRWGDYSAAITAGSMVWMAAEFIPPQSYRDFNTNWGTFIFSAPSG